MSARPSKFYSLTFREIKDIVWASILKKNDTGHFSDTWLKKKIKEGGEKKDE